MHRCTGVSSTVTESLSVMFGTFVSSLRDTIIKQLLQPIRSSISGICSRRAISVNEWTWSSQIHCIHTHRERELSGLIIHHTALLYGTCSNSTNCNTITVRIICAYCLLTPVIKIQIYQLEIFFIVVKYLRYSLSVALIYLCFLSILFLTIGFPAVAYMEK